MCGDEQLQEDIRLCQGILRRYEFWEKMRKARGRLPSTEELPELREMAIAAEKESMSTGNLLEECEEGVKSYDP